MATTNPITVSTVCAHNVTARRVRVCQGEDYTTIDAGPIGLFVDDLDAAIAIGEAIVRQARQIKAQQAQASVPFHADDETAEIAKVVPTAVVPR